MEKQTKIALLWGTILFSLILHFLIETIPLFFGCYFSIYSEDGTMSVKIAWLSLFFYLIPALCLTGTIYFSHKWFKLTNLIISVIYMIFNLVHLVMDGIIAENAIQFILLSFIMFISIILFIESFQWRQEKT